jgi:hypothetical protein
VQRQPFLSPSKQLAGAVVTRISSKTVEFSSFSYQGRDIMSLMQKLALCPLCKVPMQSVTLASYFCKRCYLCVSQQETNGKTQLTKEDRKFLKNVNVIWG